MVTATAWWHNNNNTKPRGFSARPRGPLNPSTPVTLTKTSESSQPASTNEPCAASATTCVENFVSLHAVDQLRPSTSRVLPPTATPSLRPLCVTDRRLDGVRQYAIDATHRSTTFRIDGVNLRATGAPELDFHTGDDQGRRTPGEQRGHAEQPAREVNA